MPVAGAQADYSIILQFLLDWRKNKDVRGASCKKQVDQREIKLPNKGPEENVFGSVTIRQQIADSIRKIGAEKLWVGCFLLSSLTRIPCISS